MTKPLRKNRESGHHKVNDDQIPSKNRESGHHKVDDDQIPSKSRESSHHKVDDDQFLRKVAVSWSSEWSMYDRGSFDIKHRRGHT